MLGVGEQVVSMNSKVGKGMSKGCIGGDLTERFCLLELLSSSPLVLSGNGVGRELDSRRSVHGMIRSFQLWTYTEDLVTKLFEVIVVVSVGAGLGSAS